MSAEQDSWLARCLEAKPELAVAEQALYALGPEAHAQVIAALARLARTHESHATLALARAAEVWAVGGAEQFARWLGVGERLLLEKPINRTGASRYFALPTHAFGAGGLDTAETWCALGRELTAHAPHLGRMFFERTDALLTRPDALERLRAWLAAAEPHFAQEDWRAGLVLEAYFDTAAESVYALTQPAAWINVARALAETLDPRRVFARAPGGLGVLGPEAHARFLEAIAGWANESAEAAAMLLERLPPLLAAAVREEEIAARVEQARRESVHAAQVQLAAPNPVNKREALAVLCGVLSQLPASAARGVAALLPTLPASLALPAAPLRAYLVQIGPLAAEHPEAALAALRVLPELYARADPAHTARWFAYGAKLASENVAAAQAFFALESRTSLRVLQAGSGAAELDQSLGTWRKLIHMLSDRNVVVRRLEQPGLRPPLEAAEPDAAVAMPELVDWFPTRAQNLMVFRFLALQLAGRLEHGTYRWRSAQGRSVQGELSSEPERAALRMPLFLVAEGVRIAAWTARAYPGSARETQQLARKLLELWRHETTADMALSCDVLLALSIADLDGGEVTRESLPQWLPSSVAKVARALLSVLHRLDASVATALAVTEQLALLFDPGSLQLSAAGLSELEAMMASAASDDVGGADRKAGAEASADNSTGEPSAQAARPDELAAEKTSASGQGVRQDSYTAGATLEAQSTAGLEEAQSAVRRARPIAQLAQTYVYDEWDHTLSDYRSRHCHVHELPLGSDAGDFFGRTLRENRELLAQVRRQFEHMRPERYRVLRGLEDGEDFDLNALTDARVESRAGRTPNTRIYTARTRQARDVATLFLLDMSASTEQPLPDAADNLPPRSIIDTLKEALVVMCTALDTLGDAYAIYGFSSQGRKRVEIYEVKAFDQPLGAAAKARLGSIGPRHGTRMGAALRHALTKLSSVPAHSKHLMLLSDGFPQDQEYGEDRRTHTYGIQDTAVALRELSRAGTLPFCITVDSAGHDYLRLMCDPDQYMVIDHVEQLPRELPKIYRRIVR